jgi:NTE family protein
MDRPDILVLAAGGVLGEAWMSGVLAGIEDANGFDVRETRAFVGTSAGSIVAARLAGGRSPRRPKDPVPEAIGDADGGQDDDADPIAAIFAGAIAPVAPLVLRFGAPAGALARAALLRALPAGQTRMGDARERVRTWGTTFDGRLIVCALDRSSGRRAPFGAPGAPPADVPEAVEASCAIPGVFAPVRIGGREYVDGGAWSITNLDIAPVRSGDRVLCLDPTANRHTPRLSTMGLFRLGAGARTALEIAALIRRGATVDHVGPDRHAGELMAGSLMDRGPAVATYAAGYRQGRSL